jgi:hypothetical protein
MVADWLQQLQRIAERKRTLKAAGGLLSQVPSCRWVHLQICLRLRRK